MNLASMARHNKRNNCYESLPEEEQLSFPPIMERVRIRSVCSKIMCSKCLQIPQHHSSHIWRMRALNCTCRLLKSCFILNNILLWPGHDTLYRGSQRSSCGAHGAIYKMSEWPFYFVSTHIIDLTGGPLKKLHHHCDPASFPRGSTTQGL